VPQLRVLLDTGPVTEQRQGKERRSAARSTART
jgi:hypothetical protein